MYNLSNAEKCVSKQGSVLFNTHICLPKGNEEKTSWTPSDSPAFPKQNCHFRKDNVIDDKKIIDLFNNAINCDVFVTSAADGWKCVEHRYTDTGREKNPHCLIVKFPS